MPKTLQEKVSHEALPMVPANSPPRSWSSGGDDKVLTVKELCAELQISEATFRNLVKSGQGPPITKLSTRRIGIRQSAKTAWLDSRTSKQDSDRRRHQC